MAFGPGNHVFPGGSVEVDDSAVRVVGDPPPALLKNHAYFREALRVALVASVREAVEEVGVLLAKGQPGALRTIRRELVNKAKPLTPAEGRRTFSQSLHQGALELAWDDFKVVSRWVTPEWFPRRFDTVFFLAKMPNDQALKFDASEVERGLWLTAREALYSWSLGELPMMTATVCVLAALHGAPFTRKTHLHGDEPLDPIMFRRYRSEGRTSVVYDCPFGLLERDEILAQMRSMARTLGGS